LRTFGTFAAGHVVSITASTLLTTKALSAGPTLPSRSLTSALPCTTLTGTPATHSAAHSAALTHCGQHRGKLRHVQLFIAILVELLHHACNHLSWVATTHPPLTGTTRASGTRTTTSRTTSLLSIDLYPTLPFSLIFIREGSFRYQRGRQDNQCKREDFHQILYL
jgi:hypothetical protein